MHSFNLQACNGSTQEWVKYYLASSALIAVAISFAVKKYLRPVAVDGFSSERMSVGFTSRMS